MVLRSQRWTLLVAKRLARLAGCARCAPCTVCPAPSGGRHDTRVAKARHEGPPPSRTAIGAVGSVGLPVAGEGGRPFGGGPCSGDTDCIQRAYTHPPHQQGQQRAGLARQRPTLLLNACSGLGPRRGQPTIVSTMPVAGDDAAICQSVTLFTFFLALQRATGFQGAV